MQQMQNRVTLIGNLGSEVELKTLESGQKVARVSLATNDYKKSADGTYEQTKQWHNIVAWGGKAEAMQRVLGKGSYVVIYGRLIHRNFEDSDGRTRYITEIVVREFDSPKAKAA